MKAVNKRLYYVGVSSLSVFRGDFVLAKVLRVDQCPLFGVERCLLGLDRRFEMY